MPLLNMVIIDMKIMRVKNGTIGDSPTKSFVLLIIGGVFERELFFEDKILLLL